MSVLAKMAATGGAGPKLYVDDVFSAYTYTGNGGAQAIDNGIDLAGKGGMVWEKERSSSGDHYLVDTVRGGGKVLMSNQTSATFNAGTHLTFNSNGYSLQNLFQNNSGVSLVSWTFRKAAKFFDVIAYTGNETNRAITHSLGSAPGMILIKRTDQAFSWRVYHNSLLNNEFLDLASSTSKSTSATTWNSTTATASVFNLGTDGQVNYAGGSFIAYVFAHDTSVDGLIQCGSVTLSAGGTGTVSLGWEPQWILYKSATSSQNWFIYDVSRGMPVGGTSGPYSKQLNPNVADAEADGASFALTATGFDIKTSVPNATYVYMAIRRPNKPPASGTQVYNAISRLGNNSSPTAINGVGFAPDLLICNPNLSEVAGNVLWLDRLRGKMKIASNAIDAEANSQGLLSFEINGFKVNNNGEFNSTPAEYVYWLFKRAPGVFDVVCYSATNLGAYRAHNLAVVPELIIEKRRDAAGTNQDWYVWHKDFGGQYKILLNTTAAKSTPAFVTAVESARYFSETQITSTRVAYLFATKAGISKVGSYTGNGSNQAVACGFAAGARFIMIKRTDAVGDWYVWDSVRGIVAGNDPHISLNNYTAEVASDDSVDPDASGFIVNQVAATNINVSGGTYIFLAFA